jgi:hypothetical protein
MSVPEVTTVMRKAVRLVHRGDGQAVDVVAAAGEEADDARQHARLVLDQTAMVAWW